MSGWRRDVVTGHRAMSTTGGSTWDAALKLCDYLEAEWASLCGKAVEVIELGAGTGWRPGAHRCLYMLLYCNSIVYYIILTPFNYDVCL